jgi:hypothetical protein
MTNVQERCTVWLEELLFPLLLEAEGLSPTTTPAQLLERRPRRREVTMFFSTVECEDLAMVTTAVAVAECAGNERARRVRDAVLLVVGDVADAWEECRELAGSVPEGCALSADSLAHEEEAEARLDRLRALDAPIWRALQQLFRTVADYVSADIPR